jgi:putative transposase
MGLSRAAYYKTTIDWAERDAEVADQLNKVLDKKPRYGFWKSCKVIRRKRPWNHKRIYRVYCGLGLNHKRRAKKRIPKRVKQPLLVPEAPNQVWSADCSPSAKVEDESQLS